MKTKIHPPYQPVIFRDHEANYAFLTRSTATSSARLRWEDGREYPVINVDVSAASHPAYGGRLRRPAPSSAIAKFQARYGGA